MAKTPRPRWNEIIPTIDKGSGEQSVGEANIVAPFTTIQNRAKVEANCKVVGASERIRCNSLRLVPNEFGPNGEPVYTSDKEDSRIRFIGSNWETLYDTSGTRILKVNTGVATTVVEVTYYGTGLNLLAAYNGTGFTFDEQTDNGIINNIVSSFNPSLVLGGRNTNLNNVQPITSDLPLGWHTTKIIYDLGTHGLYGFEILNESSDLTVLSGSIFKRGYEYKLESNTTVPMIPTAYSGTNGGRVLTYIDENFEVQQAVNEVGTPLYLGDANHSNEAIYRKINFREFGRERPDDFSTLSTSSSDRAFTLDDGTTTLVGDDVQVFDSGLVMNSTNDYIVLSFVGTGLDIITERPSGTTPTATTNVLVDGNSISDSLIFNRAAKTTTKICSGLPYGTHTVKIIRTSTGEVAPILDFILYQPKKPTVAKELPILADYNLMADFVQLTDAGDNDSVDALLTSQGVIKKSNMREFIYQGSWLVAQSNAVSPSGFFTYLNTGTGYAEYTFFGTGVDIRYHAQADGGDIVVSIDGSSDLSGFTTNISTDASGGFDPETGTIDANTTTNAYGNSLAITGLSLGMHTIRLNRSTGVLRLNSIDIITPIHAPNLMIGSLGISDKRQTLSDIKTNVNVDMPDSQVKVSNNIAQVLQSTVSTGVVHIYYEEVFTDENIDISSVSTFAGNRITSVGGGILRSHKVDIAHYIASTGAKEDGSCSVQLDGKKQKDVFKD